jgi:hypothetical protein
MLKNLAIKNEGFFTLILSDQCASYFIPEISPQSTLLIDRQSREPNKWIVDA